MKQKRCVPRKPVQELTAETPQPEHRQKPLRRLARHWCGNCRDNDEMVDAMIAAGVESKLTGPPTHDIQTDDGEAITEALTLVGTVRAPASARERLERAGIDLRYAHHCPGERRWVRCLFSEAGVDRLLEHMARSTFPYPFHATSSIRARMVLARREGAAEPAAIPSFWFLMTDFGGRSVQGSRSPGSSRKARGLCDGSDPSLRTDSEFLLNPERAGESANVVVHAGGAQS